MKAVWLKGLNHAFILIYYHLNIKGLLMDFEFYLKFKGIIMHFLCEVFALLVHASSLAHLKPAVHTTVLANAQMFVVSNL